jgi:hypothetical protein
MLSLRNRKESLMSADLAYLEDIAWSLGHRAIRTVEAGRGFDPVLVPVKDDQVLDPVVICRPVSDGPFIGRLYTDVGRELELSDKQEALTRLAWFLRVLDADSVVVVMDTFLGSKTSEVKPSEDPAGSEAIATLELTSAGFVRSRGWTYGRTDDGTVCVADVPKEETAAAPWGMPGEFIRMLRMGLDPAYAADLTDLDRDVQADMKFLSGRGFRFLPLGQGSFINGDPSAHHVEIDQQTLRDDPGQQTVVVRVMLEGAVSVHDVDIEPVDLRSDRRSCKRLFLREPALGVGQDVRTANTNHVVRREAKGATTYYRVISDRDSASSQEVLVRCMMAEYAVAMSYSSFSWSEPG